VLAFIKCIPPSVKQHTLFVTITAIALTRRFLLDLHTVVTPTQYDNRLKYADAPAHDFSCAQWAAKTGEWMSAGINLVIFQAVHDARYGA
jgi:hypothetical protein